jgi:hypothetical protein
MVWDWGFNWKNIYVLSCYIALDLTDYGGDPAQGTGSISVVNSHFNGAPYAITLSDQGPRPNIILDNLFVEDSSSVLLISGSETILDGSTDALYFNSWGMGLQYLNSNGGGGLASSRLRRTSRAHSLTAASATTLPSLARCMSLIRPLWPRTMVCPTIIREINPAPSTAYLPTM